MQGEVIAVSRNGEHKFSKKNQPVIELIAGLGVRDDAHAGVTVKHRVRVREDPSRPKSAPGAFDPFGTVRGIGAGRVQPLSRRDRR